jgi:multidrug resistance efflux pump
MADDSPIKQEPATSHSETPAHPAPLSRALFFITIALLTSVALCWCLRRKGSPPETATMTGRPTPVISDWTGRIERILVKPGDSVQAGQTIAVLINEQLLLDIDRQEREVSEIQLALERAERSVDQELARRLQAIDNEVVSLKTQAGLLDAGQFASDITPAVVRVRELESLRISAAHAVREDLGVGRIREEMIRAEAKLRELHSQPREVLLPAPVTGTIRRVLRKAGERVVEGTPLLELANQDQPFLVVEMPEPIAKRFALGDTIPLNFPGRENSIGRVANMRRLNAGEADPILPDEDSKATNVRLEIEPAEEDWPEIPLTSPVQVRTSDARAMSRRVN